MKAIFKDDKRLLVRNINREERVLLDSFVAKFQKYKVGITDLLSQMSQEIKLNMMSHILKS